MRPIWLVKLEKIYNIKCQIWGKTHYPSEIIRFWWDCLEERANIWDVLFAIPVLSPHTRGAPARVHRTAGMSRLLRALFAMQETLDITSHAPPPLMEVIWGNSLVGKEGRERGREEKKHETAFCINMILYKCSSD